MLLGVLVHPPQKSPQHVKMAMGSTGWASITTTFQGRPWPRASWASSGDAMMEAGEDSRQWSQLSLAGHGDQPLGLLLWTPAASRCNLGSVV